jgi:hypothetical protein
MRESRAGIPAATELPYAGLLRQSGKVYYQQASMNLAVKDTLAANDEIAGIAEKHKCEIVNLLIEGNDASRRCNIEFSVPSDKFTPFVKALRGIGQVLNEQITAQLVTGTSMGGSDDRAEFSRVKVDLVDDGARRGVFSSAFRASGNHFVSGSSLLLEGFGMILPYAIATVMLLGGIFVVRMLTRHLRARWSQL